MMVFTATVRDRDGNTRQIVRNAVSSSDFAAALRSEGLLVVSVSEAPEDSSGRPKNRRFRFRRMSSFAVEMGLRQISSMLTSGITLLLAVRTVAEQSPSRRVRRVWDSIADKIVGGMSFAAALEDDIGTFGEITVRLAEVGEKTGELENTMRRAADQLENARDLRTAVVNALVYPALALITTFAVTAYLVGVVIPKLGEFLVESGGELPAITQFLLDISGWFRLYSLDVLVWTVAAAALWWAVRLTEKGRELEDALILRVPRAGKVLKVAGTSIFARSVQIMTESGLTLLDTLDTSARIVTNRRLRRRVETCRAAIVAGSSLSDSLAEAREFMPMLRHMAAVGEVSGSLPNAFRETARYHELVLAITIKRLGIFIEPVMILITGTIVGFVYIAFFMALFAIATAA
jgi:type IV pilus assembly protein PilC